MKYFLWSAALPGDGFVSRKLGDSAVHHFNTREIAKLDIESQKLLVTRL